MQQRNLNIFTSGLIFFLTCLFSFMLLQNLPFTFGDDLNIIQIAKTTSWSRLWHELMNPLTAAWYVHGTACQLSTRIFQTLLFKFFYSGFGYSVNIFWLHKAVGFALCCSFIYLFVQLAVKSRWVSMCAAVFFALCAPVLMTTAWIADTEIVAQGFVAVGFYCFILMFYKREPKNAVPVVKIILFFLFAWLGMKLKETARIIPLVCSSFLFIYFVYFQRKEKIANARILIILSFILLFSIIPWINEPQVNLDKESTGALRQIRISGLFLLLRRLLDYFAPPLACIALLSIVNLKNKNLKSIKDLNVTHPIGFFLFLILWLSFSSIGFMFNFKVNDNWRYLVTPLLPATILVFSWLGILVDSMNAKNHNDLFKKLFLILILLASLFQCFIFGTGRSGIAFKLDEFLYVRNFSGGTDIAIQKMVTHVYAVYFHKKNPDWEDLDDFYRNDKKRFVEIQRKEWDPNENLTQGNLQKTFDKWGAVYVFSFNGALQQKYPYLNKIHHDTTDNQSLYTHLLKKVKKKAVRHIYLYEFVTSHPLTSQN